MKKVFMYSYNKLSWQQSELFHLLKKLGESITPSKARISPHSSAHEQDVEPPGSVLCVSDTIMPIAQRVPSASLQAEFLSAASRSRLSGRTVVGTAGGKRCLFYCWAVCEIWPGY